jgi:hypothetical protein
MSLILFAVVIVAILGAYAFWVIRQAMVSSCPNCARDQEDAPLIPVLFNLLWWCPSCGQMQQSRVLRAAVRRTMEDDSSGGFSLRRRRKTDEDGEVVDEEDLPPAPRF